MAECEISFQWQYHAGDAFKSAHRVACSVVDGVVYQTGGWVAAADRTEVLSVTTTDLESGKREDDVAASSEAAPADRAGHTSSVIDNSQVVVIGGERVSAFGDDSLLGDAWALDVAALEWRQLQTRVVDDPGADAAGAGASKPKGKDKGGKKAKGGKPAKGKPAAPSAADGEDEAPATFPCRTGHSAVVVSALEVVDSKDEEAVAARDAAREAAEEAGEEWAPPTVQCVLVFGGRTVPPPPPADGDDADDGGAAAKEGEDEEEPAPPVDPSFLNDLWLLMPSSGVWVRKQATGEAPGRRAYHSATLIGDAMAVFGGFNGFDRLGQLFMLDTTSWAWSEVEGGGLGAVPSARCFHAAAVASFTADAEGSTTEALVVFGGNGNGGDADTNLHLYESKSNEWTVLDVSRSDRVPPATTGHQLLAVQQRLPVYTFVTDRPTVAAPARGASGSGDGGPPTQITTSTSITRSVVDVSVASVTAGSRAGDASTGAGAGAGAGSTTTGFRSADTDIVLHTEEAAPAEEAPPAPRKPWKPPVRGPPLPQPSELGRLQPVAKSQGPLLVFGGRCTGKPAGVWSVSTRIRVAGESEEEAEASSKHVYGNGDVYYGDWERDMRHGSGRCEYADGSKYVGQWVDDARAGQGTLTAADGTVYEGEWAEDKRTGHGRLEVGSAPLTVGGPANAPLNLASYTGDVVDGLPHGTGAATFADGSRYDGTWTDGRVTGKGTFNFADGRVYTGVVVDGTAHGSGKMVYPDGNVYTGEFAAGLRDGRGVLDIANGTVYDGEWRNDVRNGIGRQTYLNRDMYTGKWVSDKRCGRGTFMHAAGHVYEGIWEEDMRHGKGRYVTRDGHETVGVWVKDVGPGGMRSRRK